MNKEQNNSHFEGKNVTEHLHSISAKKDQIVEPHAFPQNKCLLFFSSFKNILVFLLITTLFVSLTFSQKKLPWSLLFSLGIAYSLWTALQKVWQEWSYLELYHRWMQQERQEIEDHLDQEIQELHCIYENKGFHGKLLDQIVTYLSSDSNLLLLAMIEEEFGINLKASMHPLQQGFFMFLGGLTAISTFLLVNCFFSILYTTIITGSILIALNTWSSFMIKNKKIKSAVWSLTIFIFSILLSLFIYKTLNSQHS